MLIQVSGSLPPVRADKCHLPGTCLGTCRANDACPAVAWPVPGYVPALTGGRGCDKHGSWLCNSIHLTLFFHPSSECTMTSCCARALCHAHMVKLCQQRFRSLVQPTSPLSTTNLAKSVSALASLEVFPLLHTCRFPHTCFPEDVPHPQLRRCPPTST